MPITTGTRLPAYSVLTGSALDGRNTTAQHVGTGGLLQAATYVTALSGGSWLVTLLAQANFPEIQDLYWSVLIKGMSGKFRSSHCWLNRPLKTDVQVTYPAVLSSFSTTKSVHDEMGSYNPLLSVFTPVKYSGTQDSSRWPILAPYLTWGDCQDSQPDLPPSRSTRQYVALDTFLDDNEGYLSLVDGGNDAENIPYKFMPLPVKASGRGSADDSKNNFCNGRLGSLIVKRSWLTSLIMPL
ncbi:hypothetical protein GGX14DRAFT_669458 [Mycena pura]|uniref:Lysophospholipase n=1 Tax=Mycena pura TaxID=153505 RepID=A0AAD6YK60_9AGAR|nr:hypothetical protein GGX14DRAFT_669458 [Mycena pura]